MKCIGAEIPTTSTRSVLADDNLPKRPSFGRPSVQIDLGGQESSSPLPFRVRKGVTGKTDRSIS